MLTFGLVEVTVGFAIGFAMAWLLMYIDARHLPLIVLKLLNLSRELKTLEQYPTADNIIEFDLKLMEVIASLVEVVGVEEDD